MENQDKTATLLKVWAFYASATFRCWRHYVLGYLSVRASIHDCVCLKSC